VWVSPEFVVERVEYATDATLGQGLSDHAAVVVDVDLPAA
jgi:endonuclease/exonuclease/phosphatase family metal-dependent hydrolase